MRRAFNLAFDFEDINRTIFYGLYQRVNSFFAGTELASSGLPEGSELAILEALRDKVPAAVFTDALRRTRSTARPRRCARTCARRCGCCSEAGYELRGQQLVDKTTGEPFAVEFLGYDPSLERFVLPYLQALARIGITMSIRTVDAAQFQNRLRSFDFDMTTDLWAQSLSPGNEQREFWGSAAADRPGSRNIAGIKDAGVDALIDKVIFAKDRDELVAADEGRSTACSSPTTTSCRNSARVETADRALGPLRQARRLLPEYGGSGFPTIWWYDESQGRQDRSAAMTEKRRSPSPASERSRGDGTPVQDMARGRERAPSPRLRGEGRGEGPGSSRPRPLTRSAEPVLGLAGGKTRGRVGLSPLCGERGFAPRRPHRRGSARRRRACPPRPRACRGGRDRIARPLDLRRAAATLPTSSTSPTSTRTRRRAARSHSRSSAAPATRTSTPSTRSTSSSCKGDGAAGMDATFDTPDGRLGRRAGRALRPRSRGRCAVGRQAHLPLPAAARSALPRRLAADGAGRRLLAQRPQDQGPPDLPHDAERAGRGRGRERRRARRCSFVAEPQPRPASHRRRQCRSSRRPTGGTATSRPRRSSRRSAPAPTRSAASSRAASSSSTACRTTGAGICR